ncbi:G-protein coupled receptor 182 [Corythoichthys intestinalis]|uniref:G-protein coupled receptor 182 n=1 Tax=Corythoichthys intestinalis TaxID=161448 RepID=UPI0025A4F760|nr:G-protein coupled receptor 182 [Corythoichthys intestinalis]XP_057686482.1 G-protein coupled receptor 182 [Corythoichthys intestinalis]
MSNLSGNATPWFVSECTLRLDAEWRRICLFLLYLFVFSAGLLENLLVLWVNWRRRRSASGVLFCVLNVSLSDLMVMGVLPFFMLEVTVERVWLWGRFLCKLSSLVYGVNFYSSSFFLAAATLERYLALSSRPALFRGRRRWALCAGLWLSSLLLALVENIHVDLLEWDEPGCYMLPEGNYVEWFVSVAFLCLIFQFLGPASIIVVCNTLMARALRTAAPQEQRRDRRDVLLLHVYSLVFLACWLPYHLIMTLMIIADLAPHVFSCNVVEFVYFSFSVVQSFSLFHCVANPILYNFLSKSFRDNLVNALVSHLPVAGAGAGEAALPQRKLSNGSTVQSDAGQ